MKFYLEANLYGLTFHRGIFFYRGTGPPGSTPTEDCTCSKYLWSGKRSTSVSRMSCRCGTAWSLERRCLFCVVLGCRRWCAPSIAGCWRRSRRRRTHQSVHSSSDTLALTCKRNVAQILPTSDCCKPSTPRTLTKHINNNAMQLSQRQLMTPFGAGLCGYPLPFLREEASITVGWSKATNF